jgi:hypothetical protein
MPNKGLVILAFALFAIAAAGGVFAFLYETRKTTEKCDQELKCDEMLEGGGLPGGMKTAAYSHSPWSIGGRDCPWFAAKPERCKLPALVTESGAKDLCFDVAYWTDKKGDDCIWWTHWVTGDENKMWSPAETGDHEKCNKSPESVALLPGAPKNMTAYDLEQMKSACCVCGGGRSQRDYSGPLSGINAAWEKPPQPMLPKQHAGKTPTHLTQCCVCKDEAVRQALVGASAERTTEVNANMRIDGNPRGGFLVCDTGLKVDWNAWDQQNFPYILGWGIGGAALLLLSLVVCVCDGRTRQADAAPQDSGNSFDSEGMNAPFIIRL